MRVTITPEDIARGDVRRPSTHCPVANALRREGHLNVRVTPNAYRADGRSRRLDAEAREVVRRFDYGEPLEPVELELGEQPWPYA